MHHPYFDHLTTRKSGKDRDMHDDDDDDLVAMQASFARL